MKRVSLFLFYYSCIITFSLLTTIAVFLSQRCQEFPCASFAQANGTCEITLDTSTLSCVLSKEECSLHEGYCYWNLLEDCPVAPLRKCSSKRAGVAVASLVALPVLAMGSLSGYLLMEYYKGKKYQLKEELPL